jgi:uncharacterized cupin superfamily protein
MPKIDMSTVPRRVGVGYPEPFAALSAHRVRLRLGAAGGLTDFGVNLTRLPPGEWSSQRHWHSDEDEFVFVLEGEVVLIEDAGETTLRAGEAAAFPQGSGDGHHMINRSGEDAVYLEIGSRRPEDVTTCSDVDMISCNADGPSSTRMGRPTRQVSRTGTAPRQSPKPTKTVASSTDLRSETTALAGKSWSGQPSAMLFMIT